MSSLISPKQLLGANAKLISAIRGMIQAKQIGPIEPEDVTTASLVAKFLAPASIQMATTLEGTGSSPPTVTIASASSLIGRTEGVRLQIPTLGSPGTGKVDISIDNGLTFVETNVTIPTTPFTHLISGTDLTLTFGNAAYALNNVYRAVCNPWLDIVGAYPSSTNNFSNATSTQRPIIVAPTAARFGSACIRFDGSNDRIGTTGTLGTAYQSGADKAFYRLSVVDVRALPGAGVTAVLWCASNLTDTDLPRVQLSLFGTGPIFQSARRSNTGVVKQISSTALAGTGQNILEHGFDGDNGLVAVNSADYIGGNSGIAADQDGLTVTTTQMVLGGQQTQAGTSNFSNYDLYADYLFDVMPTKAERIGLIAGLFT